MTRRDVPYVVFIMICMVIAFMSGRYSVPDAPPTAAVPIMPAHPPISVPKKPVINSDHHADVPVVPVEALPVTVTMLPETKPIKDASKPESVKPIASAVPEKIELEEDPSAVQNPYKTPRMIASTPGF